MNACLRFKSNFFPASFENFGTILIIKNAQIIPNNARIGILESPKYCAIEEDNNGPIEKPKVPAAINIPIFLAASDVVNFDTNPND